MIFFKNKSRFRELQPVRSRYVVFDVHILNSLTLTFKSKVILI